MRKSLLAVFHHPLTKGTRRVVRGTVATCAVILAVAVVTSVTVDLGPGLRKRAETAGTQALKRPMHIGTLSVRLWRGTFVVSDSVGATHEVGTNDCAARWKIQSGFTLATVS